MKYRKLGKTGLAVSEISLGTWQLGGKWGASFDAKNASQILNTSLDAGVNFIDTADVYNNGMSEQAIGHLLKSRKERVYVATKCGRKIHPHMNATYTPEVLRKFVEDSLRNMSLECIDLIQLHCPPPEVYDRPEIFELFDTLKNEGKIAHMGVSVEKVKEAMKAIQYPQVTTVQIIFNMLRPKPSEIFFKEAKEKNIGIIARVPLASGLLTGKFNTESVFAPQDHRNYNRHGEHFDKGETFSGVDFEKGLDFVDDLKRIFPAGRKLSHIALRWILMFQEVSCVIPGASAPEQFTDSLEALKLPPLSPLEMEEIEMLYQRHIKEHVHLNW
jgi:aryl-alcohol dehydrogenase-like predicted oxidoreductase